MYLKKIPNKTIDNIVNFIADNDLGPIEFFHFGEKGRKENIATSKNHALIMP